eukprot:6053350-Pyramimonas_sp.AAC.1
MLPGPTSRFVVSLRGVERPYQGVQGSSPTEYLCGGSAAVAGLSPRRLSGVLMPRGGGALCPSSCGGGGLLSTCYAVPVPVASVLDPNAMQSRAAFDRLSVRC